MFLAAFAISRDGWAAFPHSAEVAVARGTVYEMRATLAMSTGVNPLRDRGYGIRRDFEAAASEYQRALTEDPTFAFAYLHRGWVHVQVGDSRATADLESALREAKDDNVRYLAHLFLGAAAERRDDLEGARRHFEAAHQLGPFQTSAVALSRVETAMGHADRARAIGAAFAQLRIAPKIPGGTISSAASSPARFPGCGRRRGARDPARSRPHSSSSASPRRAAGRM